MQLIVNADDFGLTTGVNQAIIACHQAGSVSSATLIVNMQASEDAAALAKSNPDLGVGLHFNLTLGSPVSQVQGLPLDDRGQFRPRSACAKAIISGRVSREAIAAEFSAQLARFRSFGIPMSHVDSHQHIHMLPRVYDVVADICRVEGIPLRMPWVWRGTVTQRSMRRRVRSRLLRLLILRNRLKWRRRLAHNGGFGSLFDLVSEPDQVNLETYRRLLTEAGKGRPPFELMVHPAIIDAQLQGLTRITDFSAVEYELLRSRSFRALIDEAGFELVSYRQARLI